MTDTRQELEQYVCAWNTALKGATAQMDLVTLLRNSHPAYRPAFAMTLWNEKQISKDEAKEFAKLL